MVADMVAFVASQFTTSTWDVGAQELCSVVLINKGLWLRRVREDTQRSFRQIPGNNPWKEAFVYGIHAWASGSLSI